MALSRACSTAAIVDSAAWSMAYATATDRSLSAAATSTDAAVLVAATETSTEAMALWMDGKREIITGKQQNTVNTLTSAVDTMSETMLASISSGCSSVENITFCRRAKTGVVAHQNHYIQ